MMLKNWFILLTIGMISSCSNGVENQLDLSKATILISPSIKSPVHETAVNILIEEIQERTSLQLKTGNNWDNQTIIALALSEDENVFGENIPHRMGDDLPELKEEGYRIFHESKNGKDILWITGGDARGMIYGIGWARASTKFTLSD